MQKRWILQPKDSETAQRLAQEYQIPPLITQILLNRDIKSSEEVGQFLKPTLAHLPDPSQIKDMDRAVARLIQAIQKKEPITIYGDYDVDGTTATALLISFFQAVGAVIDFYIPHRLKEGYSLNRQALEKLKAQGTRVVVTVDNGISACQEAEMAKQLGLDLIITDHHEPPPELPKAFAILNPRQPGDPFPDKQMAGVGVAFYLTLALRRALREASLLPDQEPNLKQSLDLVAVGTIADMAPLRGINRTLVREGLKVLARTRRPGLKALLYASGVDGEVRADQVAFRIGPRINAVGRLEDASLGVRLLLTQDPQEGRQLAERLSSANVSRKEMEDRMTEEAVALIETEGLAKRYRSLVVYHPDWHPGVVGIVASRLVERYYLPSIVLSRDGDALKGSARSISKFHIVEGLRECGKYLEKFGGHAYAAGLTLLQENLDAFREKFDQMVRTSLGEEDFSPSLRLDAESAWEHLNPDLLEHLKRLEPFGLGNPAPTFLIRGARVQESRIVGEKHLRLRVGEGRRAFGAIGFRLGEKQPQVDAELDLAFIPEWNEWNGNKNIQLRLLDLRVAQD